MQKVRLFAKCFKTWYNCRVWINPNFKLNFLPKVLTNLFKTTSTGENSIEMAHMQNYTVFVTSCTFAHPSAYRQW
jgi:hypothetical protein